MNWQLIGVIVAIIAVVVSTSMSAWQNLLQRKTQMQQTVDIRTNVIQQIGWELSKTGRRLQAAAQIKNHELAKFDRMYGLYLIDTGIEAIKTDLQVSNDDFHGAVVHRFRDLASGFVAQSGTTDQFLETAFPRIYRFKKGIP